MSTFFKRNTLSGFCIVGAICLGSITAFPSALATQPNALSITPDMVDLSGEHFLRAFVSQSPDDRNTARLYLLGVLDTTEGNSWCSYNQIKTVSINEFVFEYLKKQPIEKQQVRAATLIQEALSHYFPCKDEK
ncbi:hypothetical protein CBP51_06125 [Cellvibrio mixtus]|uniref:Rap1a immunity protein domain-containing protein n=1 Tax=Cellvibrio mixtus TaxID=39650 RepID=A0A266Q9N5_9GAMM|nr:MULTISPECIES: Rap1a/Tai family immunity protein [Cellvibrio]AQT62083.1 hypothetical protein B0D95_19690 [Cellvibrio sp. PSBB023]OZY86594.1 hypothetical protein CBP51_06125 [Cellvibrio mixtus]